MLLTITTTHQPATDLGYLLHKNPARTQMFNLSFGTAHVLYPEAESDRCTVALVLEIDPIGLVRGRRGPAGEGGFLAQYVNDRPYVASSFLSVAIADVFGTAMTGRCKDRPELAETAITLTVRIPAVPCRGGEAVLRGLFEPLGYTVSADPIALDERNPDWGPSRYLTVTLERTCRLSEFLSHLYVLLPVLDDEKHYWVGDDEVEKLLRRGEGWLAAHPEKDTIVRRYLRHRRALTRQALEQLVVEEDPDPDAEAVTRAEEESRIEKQISLAEQRLGTVLAALRESGAKRVVDLGCGEGRYLRAFLDEKSFTEILGVDVSMRALQVASSRLKLDRMSEIQRARIKLLQGSLAYRDKRLEGYDAATVVEVIEHLDPPRLSAFERSLFEFARPGTVVLTTPNIEYNVKFETLPAGRLRHRDHRFEWTRTEFERWASSIADRFAYRVRFLPVGSVDSVVGPPTQMAVFNR